MPNEGSENDSGGDSRIAAPVEPVNANVANASSIETMRDASPMFARDNSESDQYMQNNGFAGANQIMPDDSQNAGLQNASFQPNGSQDRMYTNVNGLGIQPDAVGDGQRARGLADTREGEPGTGPRGAERFARPEYRAPGADAPGAPDAPENRAGRFAKPELLPRQGSNLGMIVSFNEMFPEEASVTGISSEMKADGDRTALRHFETTTER
jgi:hypothetical protein